MKINTSYWLSFSSWLLVRWKLCPKLDLNQITMDFIHYQYLFQALFGSGHYSVPFRWGPRICQTHSWLSLVRWFTFAYWLPLGFSPSLIKIFKMMPVKEWPLADPSGPIRKNGFQNLPKNHQMRGRPTRGTIFKIMIRYQIIIIGQAISWFQISRSCKQETFQKFHFSLLKRF